jgi:hypothetical protein
MATHQVTSSFSVTSSSSFPPPFQFSQPPQQHHQITDIFRRSAQFEGSSKMEDDESSPPPPPHPSYHTFSKESRLKEGKESKERKSRIDDEEETPSIDFSQHTHESLSELFLSSMNGGRDQMVKTMLESPEIVARLPDGHLDQAVEKYLSFEKELPNDEEEASVAIVKNFLEGEGIERLQADTLACAIKELIFLPDGLEIIQKMIVNGALKRIPPTHEDLKWIWESLGDQDFAPAEYPIISFIYTALMAYYGTSFTARQDPGFWLLAQFKGGAYQVVLDTLDSPNIGKVTTKCLRMIEDMLVCSNDRSAQAIKLIHGVKNVLAKREHPNKKRRIGL